MELQHLAEVSRNEAIVFGHRLRSPAGAVGFRRAFRGFTFAGSLSHFALRSLTAVIVWWDRDKPRRVSAGDKTDPIKRRFSSLSVCVHPWMRNRNALRVFDPKHRHCDALE